MYVLESIFEVINWTIFLNFELKQSTLNLTKLPVRRQITTNPYFLGLSICLNSSRQASLELLVILRVLLVRLLVSGFE